MKPATEILKENYSRVVDPEERPRLIQNNRRKRRFKPKKPRLPTSVLDLKLSKNKTANKKHNYDIFFKYNTKDSKLIKERRKRLHNHIRSEIHSWCADREVQKAKENEIIEEIFFTALYIFLISF